MQCYLCLLYLSQASGTRTRKPVCTGVPWAMQTGQLHAAFPFTCMWFMLAKMVFIVIKETCTFSHLIINASL